MKQVEEVHLGRLVQGFQGGPLILQPQHFLSEALQLILCCCCFNLSQHIHFHKLVLTQCLVTQMSIISEHATAECLPFSSKLMQHVNFQPELCSNADSMLANVGMSGQTISAAYASHVLC